MTTETQFDVTVLGLTARDYLFYLDRFPSADTKCSARRLVIAGGGVGANIAWSAARLGARCAMLTKIGDDEDGRALLSDFERVGLHITGIVIARGRSSTTMVIVDLSTGTRTCINDRSGIAPLNANEVFEPACRNAQVLVVDGRFGDASIRACSLAKKSQRCVVYSMERIDDATRELCGLADVVVAPEHLLPAGDNLEERVSSLVEALSVSNLVVTLGASGCAVATRITTTMVPATKVEPVDSVGAGDAFVAGLSFGLARKVTLEKACEFGNWVAARSCEREGARTGVPDSSAAAVKLAVVHGMQATLPVNEGCHVGRDFAIPTKFL